MDAKFIKITRPDPNSNGSFYSDCTLIKDITYCCDIFKAFCKKFPSWNYEKGKFTIVDEITYENNTHTQINYCPFCGEKIKYKEIKPKKKS